MQRGQQRACRDPPRAEACDGETQHHADVAAEEALECAIARGAHGRDANELREQGVGPRLTSFEFDGGPAAVHCAGGNESSAPRAGGLAFTADPFHAERRAFRT